MSTSLLLYLCEKEEVRQEVDETTSELPKRGKMYFKPSIRIHFVKDVKCLKN